MVFCPFFICFVQNVFHGLVVSFALAVFFFAALIYIHLIFFLHIILTSSSSLHSYGLEIPNVFHINVIETFAAPGSRRKFVDAAGWYDLLAIPRSLIVRRPTRSLPGGYRHCRLATGGSGTILGGIQREECALRQSDVGAIDVQCSWRLIVDDPSFVQ